jgi:EAL domain-containing protein (putative c-di-GMP-specific phosphodiesterase class I)
VRRTRSEADQQVAALLRTAKESLQLSVAFLSRLDGETQHLEVVESSIPVLFQEGNQQRQETSLCQAVLDGDLPAVMPDLRAHPLAMSLPAARLPRIRSYVSVPVVLSDGELYGTFCAAGLSTAEDLSPRDEALMAVLASAAATIVEPTVREQRRSEELLGRLRPVLAAGGPAIVLQPIVDLRTGERVGHEALSRFPAEWGKAPDVCFAEAHSVGLGDELELQALHRAAAHLTGEGYLSMNISPDTLLTPGFTALMDQLPVDRVLLELSEHDQVADYDALAAVLDPLRARGMRLAIDDVGAGFSSLRHIVVTTPDVLKVDRSLVSGIDSDPVLTRLVSSLVEFGHGCGATLVAEGVETAAEAAVLRDLQVDCGQGWLFGRPELPWAPDDDQQPGLLLPAPRPPVDGVTAPAR